MSPPAGFSDFYELELQINYNNAASIYLQGYSAAAAQPPQEQQRGWTESYYLFTSSPPSGSNLPIQNAYQLVQARASVLGLNFYIKKAICHQGSVFKSSQLMPNSAQYALFDSLALYSGYLTPQYCSAPEETVMVRLEANNLRSWEHQMRGIKDYMSDDTMSYFAATSYADYATFTTTSVFDALQVSIPPAGFTGGTAATFTVTNTNGSISLPVLVTAGSYPGVLNGQYYTYFQSASGQTQPALGSVTIAGGVATAATVLSLFPGTGYVGTNVSVPVGNDPYGLPNWQTPANYWANFLSCLISFTGSGQLRRVSSSRFTAPLPTFPSGLSPAIVNSLVKANRSMFQRIGNRQTGQIRLTKPARTRRGI